MLPLISSLNFNRYKNPSLIFRPKTLESSVKLFVNKFPGKVLYAVKANSSIKILKLIYQFGINSFDVASINEVKKVRDLFSDATIFFMNPVKPRHAISMAYFNYGVKHFSLDTKEELEKIIYETKYANDLSLHVRLSVPNLNSKIDLSKKFGINLKDAPKLIDQVSKIANKIGVSFHPGSQCMDPDSYKLAIQLTGNVIKKCKNKISYLNVGGGFPSIFPGMETLKLSNYFNTIQSELNKFKKNSLVFMSEPGRAIVAESISIVVRVDMRKGKYLYINDGIYGSLHGARYPGFIYPVRFITKNLKSKRNIPFSFFGPTCDSNDFMEGPFFLPENIKEGDFIEIGLVGAYAQTMRTTFNGFSLSNKLISVRDKPIISQKNIP